MQPGGLRPAASRTYYLLITAMTWQEEMDHTAEAPISPVLMRKADSTGRT
jgi:hypothetical protein